MGKKSLVKNIRLSESEWEQISKKMDELGMDFSKFAISSMLSRPLTKTPITKEFILELSRQGNNLNQIAKKLNKGESIDRVALSMISSALENLEKIYEILKNAS